MDENSNVNLGAHNFLFDTAVLNEDSSENLSSTDTSENLLIEPTSEDLLIEPEEVLIKVSKEETDTVKQLFLNPTNVLLALYESVVKKLQTPEYNITQRHCKVVPTAAGKGEYFKWYFHLKWPNKVCFSGKGETEVSARDVAALKALYWLRLSGKSRITNDGRLGDYKDENGKLMPHHVSIDGPSSKKLKEVVECSHNVSEVIPESRHEIATKCYENPNDGNMCDEPCDKLLQCGHQCSEKRSEPCTDQCYQLVTSDIKSACGHDVTLPCFINQHHLPSEEIAKFCSSSCGVKLITCVHTCKGTCGACFQRRVHIPCEETCGKILLCGHRCDTTCAEACPPCNRPCTYKCNHDKCKNLCGEPCSHCKFCCEDPQKDPDALPCTKNLNCGKGHLCMGFIDEPCPLICSFCNAEKVTNDFQELINKNEFRHLTNKEKRDCFMLRYVQLLDCDHVRPVLLSVNQATMEKPIYYCTYCSALLISTKRYKNENINFHKFICKIKEKLVKEKNNAEKIVEEIHTKLTEIEPLGTSLEPDLYKSSFRSLMNDMKQQKEYGKIIIKYHTLQKISTVTRKLNTDEISEKSDTDENSKKSDTDKNSKKSDTYEISKNSLNEIHKMANLILSSLTSIKNTYQEQCCINWLCIKWHLLIAVCILDKMPYARTTLQENQNLKTKFEDTKSKLLDTQVVYTDRIKCSTVSLYKAMKKQIPDFIEKGMEDLPLVAPFSKAQWLKMYTCSSQ